MDEELMERFLKEHLSIDVSEESYGFNGRCLSVKLRLKGEVISCGSYTLNQDEG